MKENFDILQFCPLFYVIKKEDYEPMLSCLGAVVKSFEAKESVFSEGDKADWVGIVLSGTVQIVRVDYDGNRSILSKIHKSEIFAESFSFAGVDEMPVSVVAEEKTRVLLLRSSRIITPCSNVCDFHNSIIHNMLRIMARKNLNFHRKLEITSQKTTREKLMSFLMLQAKQEGRKKFTIPFDRQELADYLGVDRSGLSAEISKLRKEGVITCRKNVFELL